MGKEYCVQAIDVNLALRQVSWDMGNLVFWQTTRSFGLRERSHFTVGSEFHNSLSSLACNDDLLTTDERKVVEQDSRPYYSKWGKDSGLVLHNSDRRFAFRTMGLGFWSLLPPSLRLYSNRGEYQSIGQLLDMLAGTPSAIDPIDPTNGQGPYQTGKKIQYWLQHPSACDPPSIIGKFRESPNLRVVEGEVTIGPNDPEWLSYGLGICGYNLTRDSDGWIIGSKDFGEDGTLDLAFLPHGTYQGNKAASMDIKAKLSTPPSIQYLIDPSIESDGAFINRNLRSLLNDMFFNMESDTRY